MASSINASAPHDIRRLEAEAEAGPGANAQTIDQSYSTVNTAEEKELNQNSSSNSSGTYEHDSSPPLEHNTSTANGGVTQNGQAAGAVATAENGNEKPGQGGSDVAKAPRTKGKVALLMSALCLAVFLAALDATIVTTALPTIAVDFQASSADYTWIGSAYLLAAAASTPTWGKISDIFGRKPILLVANVVFFIGSLICGVSVNVKMLIAGRVIQGIGGGGLLILVNICISDLFSMRERGMYFGIIGMVWAVASAVGPVLGGVFTEKVTWKWCFYVNLPTDGFAFFVLFFFLDIQTPRTPIIAGLKAIDWLGSLAIVGGTVMFLLGLEFGGVSFPWNSATVVCLIVFGVVLWVLFFLNERYLAKYPLIPTRLFSKRSNIAALATCFIHGFVFISASYFLPLYFQAVLGATPLLSGVYVFPFVISLSLVSAATGIFIRKTGQYLPPIWFGTSFMTLGFGLYINFPPYASWPRIIIYQIIAGFGIGPNFQAPLIALQSLVPGRDIAAATATFGFTRNLATSISVVLGGVIFQNQMLQQGPALRAAGLPAALANELGTESAGASTGLVAALPDGERAVVLDAYTSSLRTMWIFYTAIAACGLLASLAIGRNKLSKQHEETKTGLDIEENARKERLEEERLKRQSKAGLKDVEKGGPVLSSDDEHIRDKEMAV